MRVPSTVGTTHLVEAYVGSTYDTIKKVADALPTLQASKIRTYDSVQVAYEANNAGFDYLQTLSFSGSWAGTGSGPEGGATYFRDGTTGTPSTLHSDGAGFYDAQGSGFSLVQDITGFTVTSVSELTARSYPAGTLVHTKGYYAAGDEGHATYLIQTSSEYGDTPDEYGDHTLANGNVAVLQGGSPINILQYGAVRNTDIRARLHAALARATTSFGTGSVFIPYGHYTVDTSGGSVEIPEGVELFGDGGIQIRRPSAAKQGTVLNISGTGNAAFVFNRGVKVHDLFIDYPDQTEDPVTPTVVPACFKGDATNLGARSFFYNIIFDRCYIGFETTGGTQWDNVHGCFYRKFIKIESSEAFNHVNNCSASALWHNTTNTNTKIFQQDNLVLFEINEGSDGLLIDGFTAFTAKVGVSLVGGDQLNFFQCANSLFDGVMDPIVNDGTVTILTMQWDNCFFRLNNEHGNTNRISSIIFDGAATGSYTDQTVQFSNCRFRVVPGGVFSVVSGLDKLVLTGCTFYDWNIEQANDAQSRSLIYLTHGSTQLVITGGSVDNRNQYDAAVETRLVTVDAANRVTITGMDLNKITKIVSVSAGVTLPKLTLTGNTGDSITAPVALGAGASVTTRVSTNNNW